MTQNTKMHMVNTIARAPAVIFERLASSSGGPASGSTGLPAVGGRNDFFASVAGSLRAKGMGVDEIAPTLLALNERLREPLVEDEVIGVAKSIARYPAETAIPEITEQTMAEHYAKAASGRVCHTGDGWMWFDGTVWVSTGAGLRAQELAKEMIKELESVVDMRVSDPASYEGMRKAVKGIKRRQFISNILKLAASDPRILYTGAWDRDDGLLNFANGTFDLNSGELRPHDPQDRLTLALDYDYDPSARCPNFDKALSDALDPETAVFLLDLLGYALLGEGSLQHMLLVLGAGRNGKTTVLEAVSHALGRYAKTADPNTFMKGKTQNVANYDLYALKSARLVLMAELNQGQALDSALVKHFTGGEEISARPLYGGFVTFHPRGLLTMVSNHPPLFDGSDFGITRRMIAVKFARTIPAEQVDPHLPTKLRGEAPGIMNRLLEGLERYRKKGLSLPPAVRQSTDKLIADSNQVGRFLDEQCITGPDARISVRELYANYNIWCHLTGYRPMTQAAFDAAVERTLSCQKKRVAAGMVWIGVCAKAKS